MVWILYPPPPSSWLGGRPSVPFWTASDRAHHRPNHYRPSPLRPSCAFSCYHPSPSCLSCSSYHHRPTFCSISSSSWPRPSSSWPRRRQLRRQPLRRRSHPSRTGRQPHLPIRHLPWPRRPGYRRSRSRSLQVPLKNWRLCEERSVGLRESLGWGAADFTNNTYSHPLRTGPQIKMVAEGTGMSCHAPERKVNKPSISAANNVIHTSNNYS